MMTSVLEKAAEFRIEELEAELSELQSETTAKDNLIDDLRVELHTVKVQLQQCVGDRTFSLP